MDNNEIEILINKYSSIIDKIIKDNRKFYNFIEEIKWELYDINNNQMVSYFNQKNNVIIININAVVDLVNHNNILKLEYLILYNIELFYQSILIKNFKINGGVSLSDENKIKKWICEKDININHINCDKDKYNNLQDCEIDAMSYALAVMIYKYGDKKGFNLNIPSNYMDEVNKRVDVFLEIFNKNDVLELPVCFNSNNDYLIKLKRISLEYKAQVKIYLESEDYDKKEIDNTLNIYNKVSMMVCDAICNYLNDEDDKTRKIVKELLLFFKDVLIVKVKNSHAFLGPLFLQQGDKKNKLKHLFLYRGVIEKDGNRGQIDARYIYHIPYNMPNIMNENRFNTKGEPFTYLCDSSFVACKELKNDNGENMFISAFEITNLNQKIIDLTFPFDTFTNSINFIQKLSYGEKCYPILFAMYPFILSMSFYYNGIEDKKRKKIEYALSKEITKCCYEKNYLGIAYNSNAFEYDEFSNLTRTCLAIPLYKGKLNNIIKITEPIKFSTFKKDKSSSDNLRNFKKIYKSNNDYYGYYGNCKYIKKKYKFNTNNNKMIERKSFFGYIKGKDIKYVKKYFEFDEYILSVKKLKRIKDK